jgi:hypothetical protein
MAQMMQQANPELVEMFRRQFGGNERGNDGEGQDGNGNQGQQPPPGSG